MNIFEEVKSKIDICDYISNHLSLKLTKVGNSFKTNCPFPEHLDKNPSFIVSSKKQIFSCFPCRISGDIFQLVSKLNNLESNYDSLKTIVKQLSIDVKINEIFKVNKYNDEQRKLIDINKVALEWFRLNNSNKKFLEYIESRKLNYQQVEKFNIGFAPHSGEGLIDFLLKSGFKEEEIEKSGLSAEFSFPMKDFFKDRLIIPIFDNDGNVISFSGRTIGNDQVKYLNLRETIIFKKSDHLFNNNSFTNKKSPLIVCEGYLDVIAADSKNYNAVAIMGASVSESQLNILLNYNKEIWLGLDSDLAGINANIDLSKKLAFKDRDHKIIDLSKTDSKDLNEFLENNNFIKEDLVVNPYIYRIDTINKRFINNSTEEKNLELYKITEEANKIINPFMKEYILNCISLKTNVKIDLLDNNKRSDLNYWRNEALKVRIENDKLKKEIQELNDAILNMSKHERK